MLAQLRPAGGLPIAEEHSTFTVRVARSEDDLWKAVRVRHAAYAHHVPELAATLRAPEPYDYDDASAVLIAEAKLDGAPLGTMRIQTNRGRRLALEQSIELPDWLRHCRLAEATRLGISQGRTGRIVKMMLFKAFYYYCIAAGIEWMVIGARAPLDRQYEGLLFRDAVPGAGFVPLRHAGNIPHRIMAFEIATAEQRWQQARQPLYDFFCRTLHPDIDVSDGGRGIRGAAPVLGSPALPA